MKSTNYSRIADRYDRNQYRVEEVKVDADLREYMVHQSQSEYAVLDLSCGTGLYLEKQMGGFTDFPVTWHGLDASEKMLEKAKERVKTASLIQGFAENMPYDSESFHFISNNYAFHHYDHKEQVLNEIERVLKKGGIYKLHNIAIHDMPKWWVYQYFPAAYYEDQKRYWTKEVLYQELSLRGLTVKLTVNYRMEQIRVADYLSFAENRDISVLTLLSDQDYQQGIERMCYEVAAAPEKTIVTDFAELFCIAEKNQ